MSSIISHQLSFCSPNIWELFIYVFIWELCVFIMYSDVAGSLICIFNAKEDYKSIFHLLYNCQAQHGLFSWGRFDIFMICKDQIAQVSQTRLLHRKSKFYFDKQKLTAGTGSKFYGRIAITTQLNCDVESVIKVTCK